MTYLFFSQVMASAERENTEKLKEELKATKQNNEKLIVRATVIRKYMQIKVYMSFYLGSSSRS